MQYIQDTNRYDDWLIENFNYFKWQSVGQKYPDLKFQSKTFKKRVQSKTLVFDDYNLLHSLIKDIQIDVKEMSKEVGMVKLETIEILKKYTGILKKSYIESELEIPKSTLSKCINRSDRFLTFFQQIEIESLFQQLAYLVN